MCVFGQHFFINSYLIEQYRLEKINTKICWQKMSILFNQIYIFSGAIYIFSTPPLQTGCDSRSFFNWFEFTSCVHAGWVIVSRLFSLMGAFSCGNTCLVGLSLSFSIRDTPKEECQSEQAFFVIDPQWVYKTTSCQVWLCRKSLSRLVATARLKNPVCPRIYS